MQFLQSGHLWTLGITSKMENSRRTRTVLRRGAMNIQGGPKK